LALSLAYYKETAYFFNPLKVQDFSYKLYNSGAKLETAQNYEEV